jgi:drug/metabolite transporter (DMT)-like permease
VKRVEHLGIHLSLALLVLIWGAAYPLIKVLLRWLTPMELMLARFWITCLPLIGIAWHYRRGVVALVREHPVRTLLLALLGVPGYHLFLNIGTRMLAEDPRTAMSAAMLTSILVASVPAWTALFAHLARLERLRALQWLGQALAFAGVVLIVLRDQWGALRLTPGALWVMGAPVSWALYSVTARPLLARSPSSLPLTASTVLLGTLIMTPFTPSSTAAHLAGLGAGPLLGLVGLALLSTFAGYVIWAAAVRSLGANRTSVVVYFIPVASLLTSALALGERLTWPVVAGGAMILAGVMITQRRSR